MKWWCRRGVGAAEPKSTAPLSIANKFALLEGVTVSYLILLSFPYFLLIILFLIVEGIHVSRSLKPHQKPKYSHKPMEGSIIFLLSLLLFFTLAKGLTNPKCGSSFPQADKGSTLQVLHVNSPCSPLRNNAPQSWVDTVLQMQSKDQARLDLFASLVAGRSFVPIASGRQVIQSPTYIVRAKIGTPPQTLLVAVDNSNDVAWFPCSGCVGCSSTVFASDKSTTFKNVSCGAAQCSQVPHYTFQTNFIIHLSYILLSPFCFIKMPFLSRHKI